jgi:hypothetical protein
MFLSKRFFEETGGALGGQALEDAIRILEARAVNDGPEYEPFVRVGQRDKKQYVDLCDIGCARGAELWAYSSQKHVCPLSASAALGPRSAQESRSVAKAINRSSSQGLDRFSRGHQDANRLSGPKRMDDWLSGRVRRGASRDKPPASGLDSEAVFERVAVLPASHLVAFDLVKELDPQHTDVCPH